MDGKDDRMIRDDVSSRLIHLTRGEPEKVAAEAFLSIVKERKIRGGTECIKGGYRCVCFSEAPLSKLTQILANPAASGMRYKPFGVMVEKEWLFKRGGRPVIYQPDAEYSLLHETQRFRHVRYEPSSVDFTWEREWRIRTDELELDPSVTTLVVPNRAWEKWALGQHTAMLSRRASGWGGSIGPRSVTEFPWHFVVLEDLGVEVPSVAAPT
ncbi:MAG: hypothetical protein ABID84_05385 [Chloroflexota bacterium]